MAKLASLFVATAAVASMVTPFADASGVSRAEHIDASPLAQLMSSCPAVPAGAKNAAPGVPGGKRTVALTFDDGPGRSTAAILSILQAAHVRATFFNVGSNESARPDLVRAEASAGFLLGNHTVSHPLLTGLGTAGQTSQIDGVISIQKSIVGSVPCVFRPPYGGYNATTSTLAAMRHETLWMWNGSGDDWMARGSGSQYWINRITGLAEGAWQFSNHVVLLMHNQPIAMPATVAALPAIISFYKRSGYTFVDLMGRSGPPGTCGAPNVRDPVVAALHLQSGTQLPSGGFLDSPGGQYRLSVTAAGQLTWTAANGRLLWSPPIPPSPGSYLYMAPSGDLELLSKTGTLRWALGTSGHPGANLSIRSDGRLELIMGTKVLWKPAVSVSSMLVNEPLHPTWYLTSPNGRCRLSLTTTGRLALSDATGQLLWTNTTTSSAPGSAVLQSDGNLVVRTKRSLPTWASWTQGHRGDKVTVTNQGTVVITGATGRVLWLTE